MQRDVVGPSALVVPPQMARCTCRRPNIGAAAPAERNDGRASVVAFVVEVAAAWTAGFCFAGCCVCSPYDHRPRHPPRRALEPLLYYRAPACAPEAAWALARLEDLRTPSGPKVRWTPVVSASKNVRPVSAPIGSPTAAGSES